MGKKKITRAEMRKAILAGKVKNVPKNMLRELGINSESKKPDISGLFGRIGVDKIKNDTTPTTQEQRVATTTTANASTSAIDTNSNSVVTPKEKKADSWEQFYTPREFNVKFTPAPVINKAYKKKMSSLFTEAKKIKDPDLNAKAIDILSSNADWRQISKAIAILSYNDRAKIQAQKKYSQNLKLEVTKDRKKTNEKYAKQIGTIDEIGDIVNRLIDGYDDKLIGWFDVPQNRAGKTTDWAFAGKWGDRAKTYYDDFDKLLKKQKNIDNMGANFTKSEQSMVKRTLPDVTEKEESYKRGLASYLRGLRDTVNSSIKASERAHYSTGDLIKTKKKLDELYKKAVVKFDLPRDEYSIDDIPTSRAITTKEVSNSNAPEGFVSQTSKQKNPTPAPSTQSSNRVVIKPGDVAALNAILGGR